MAELIKMVFDGSMPETLDPLTFFKILFFIIVLQFVSAVISDLVNLTRR